MLDKRKVKKVLKKHRGMVKRYYNQGGTITICSSSIYNRYGGTWSQGITYCSDNGYSLHEYEPPHIFLRAKTGTSAKIVLHELGHWHDFYELDAKTQKKIISLYKKHVKKIRSVLGGYAASSGGEVYADTFAAIKNRSLSAFQKKTLGKWCKFVKATI